MRLLSLIGSGLCLATTAATCMDAVGRECGDLGPPPSILDMPPPPMPSFLAHIVDDHSGSNGSNSPNKDLLMETNELDPGKPCKSMCDTDQGVGFVELPQQGPIIETYSWWMLLSTCLLGVMLIGTVVLVVVVRLKDKKRWSKSDFSPEPKKSPPLYDTIAEMSPKSFWATLSPTGNIDTTATATTRSASRSRPVHHHPQTIANPNFENGAYYPFERQNHHHHNRHHHHQLQNHQQLQSFHNHHQQQQQQQQQQQEHEYQQITTIRRTMEQPEYQTIRPHVSSPTRIEHPNMPPLNLYRSIRRISDLESP